METWKQAAPLKPSRKAAEAALADCIPEDDRDRYRVVKSTRYPSRWGIQYRTDA